MRKTKIVCTLGPASADEKVMEKMLKNGMNIARLNFSHNTHEYHQNMIETFRKVRDRLGVPAAVMLDTKGPEIRIGKIKDNCALLVSGASFTFTSKEVLGNESMAYMNYPLLPKKVSVGTKILLDDGNIVMEVSSVTDTEINCTVLEGGELKSQKSINIPNTPLDMPYLSERDKSDLLFGIEQDVDFVAASFVRSKEDVIQLRKFLDYHGGHSIKIISKIENSEGVKNFADILAHSDGIMVARGDMGVEIAFEKLPGIQKKFIRACFQSGKMVITATQMLESMIKNATPTRAEITDVANAVFDGTSAVMLSGETAMGVNPARVVKVMSKIVEQAENDAFEMDVYNDMKYTINYNDTTNAICDAACTTAKDIRAKAIIAVTESGLSARRVSKFRPRITIVAATPNLKTFHQLSLSWGVNPVLAKVQNNADSLFLHAIDCAKQIDAVNNGDIVVITAGAPKSEAGTTDIIKVQVV